VIIYQHSNHYLALFVYIIPQQGFNVKDAMVFFNSNGDRIYLTASSVRGPNIQGLLQAKAILESNQ